MEHKHEKQNHHDSCQRPLDQWARESRDVLLISIFFSKENDDLGFLGIILMEIYN